MESTKEHPKSKTKTEFKRDSLTRLHEFNNILVYYIGYFFDVYAKRFFKSGNKIVPFLLVSHIVYQGEEIYRYDHKKGILKYKLPGSNEETKEVKNVQNLESDIHRRQLNIIILIERKLNINVRYSITSLKHSKIPKWNIIFIDYFDNDRQQHVITTDNVNDYYEDIKDKLLKQMEVLQKPKRIFLINNPLFVYPVHSILKPKEEEEVNQSNENNEK